VKRIKRSCLWEVFRESETTECKRFNMKGKEQEMEEVGEMRGGVFK